MKIKKHFIALVKRQGLYIVPGSSSNEELAYQINHELMVYGYALSRELFDVLKSQSEEQLHEMYADIFSGITSITGGSGHEPIYKNFPQDVIAISHREFVINAITHYWSNGTWRPNDAKHIQREFALEPTNYKVLNLLDKSSFVNILYDIIYSGNSISKMDKMIIDWFIANGVEFDFNSITFNEIKAYVGQSLLTMEDLTELPIKDATLVLRLWSLYSGGDEGLKTNTKFKLPKSRQRKILSKTLDNCYNLEESFKTYREKWLRMLYYLNPGNKGNMYPELQKYAQLLRDTPKKLETYNGKIERLLKDKNESVLFLLSRRMGVFTRRLDHTVRLFGIKAINVWLDKNPNLKQLITAYNHFSGRADDTKGRSAILANAEASNVVTYKAVAPLDSGLVASIIDAIRNKIDSIIPDYVRKKTYIARELYYRPLAVNHRASSMSLSGEPKGTLENVPKGKTIRMYMHWHGRTDIDLSGMLLYEDGKVVKVGWNGIKSCPGMAYSGDNTGHSSKNAEYLDIQPLELPDELVWVVVDAVIYSGPATFAGYKQPVHAGWMVRQHPQSNEHWLPETIAKASVIEAKSKRIYVMALHVPSHKLVHLDVSMGNHHVTTAEDTVQFQAYLDKLISIVPEDDTELPWKQLNQGQILHLMSSEVVDDPENADVVYDIDINSETVSRLIDSV